MSLDRNLLLKLAAEYGTPLYVYDGDQVLKCYRDLFAFIPYSKLRIHYAMKANYNPALLRLLEQAGASLDTVSPAEVLLGLRAGFSRERIIYTANNMTDAEVAMVHDLGVLMNIGSLSRLEKFGKAYPGSPVCLRFNPDVRDGDSEKTMTAGDLTKFGILMDDVDTAAEIARKYRLKVTGLHEHTGSGLQQTESVFQSMKNLMGLVTPQRFPDLEFMDFGGGFKVPYRPDEARIDYVAMGRTIAELFEAFCHAYGRKLTLCFEPGKYIVAEAGCLLTEVNTLKKNRSRCIAGCNSGFPQLIRPVLYGAYHRIDNLSNPDGTPQTYDICGNICETGDRFAEQRAIPEIREGDVLAIRNAGAYCYSMGSVYNLRPMPAEVLVLDGRTKLVRKALTNRQLIDQIMKESE